MQVGRNVDVSWRGIDIFVKHRLLLQQGRPFDMLGVGIGLTSIDPDDAGTLRGAGVGTGVWSLIAPVVALFVGGLVTGRVAGVFDRPLSAIHGAVVWALTTVVGVTLLVMGLAAAVGASARLAGGAIEGSAGIASRLGGEIERHGVLGGLGLGADDLAAPINRELRAQGKPANTTDQLEAATRDVVGDAVKTGRLDRAALVRSLGDHTALTQAQAGDVADRLEARWDAKRDELAGHVRDAKSGALQAAESTGKGLLVAVAAMFLSLIAAAGGATVGSMLWRRRVANGVGAA